MDAIAQISMKLFHCETEFTLHYVAINAEATPFNLILAIAL
jgi:hypothetical protein